MGEPTPIFEMPQPATFFNVDVECTRHGAVDGLPPDGGHRARGALLSKGWVLHRDRLYVRLDHGIDALTIHARRNYTSMPWWVEQSDRRRTRRTEMSHSSVSHHRQQRDDRRVR